jgi:hypothetical protein
VPREIALVARARIALLALDGAALIEARNEHIELTRERSWPPGRLCLEWTIAWTELANGDLKAARTRARALASAARTEGIAWLVPESVLIEAMAELETGDITAGVERARRASRMARAEGAPSSERLAALVLARARRFQHSAHVASFVLSALRRASPACFAPWTEWESVLATNQRPDAVFSTSPARDLVLAIDQARQGNAPLVHSALVQTKQRLAGFAPFAADLDAFAAMLIPNFDITRAGSDVHAWCAGESDHSPRGIACPLRGDEALEERGAWVIASPQSRARRIAPAGLPLARGFESAPRLALAGHSRVGTMLSALALGPPAGIDEAQLFRRIYGFEYVPARHAGARRVLYHRLRRSLPDGAVLDVSEGTVRLELATPFIVADPRCAPPPDHFILAYLATGRGASARDVSEGLGLPLRTTQDALRRLAELGACSARRDGGRDVFAIEETIFTELTPS